MILRKLKRRFMTVSVLPIQVFLELVFLSLLLKWMKWWRAGGAMYFGYF